LQEFATEAKKWQRKRKPKKRRRKRSKIFFFARPQEGGFLFVFFNKIAIINS